MDDGSEQVCLALLVCDFMTVTGESEAALAWQRKRDVVARGARGARSHAIPRENIEH